MRELAYSNNSSSRIIWGALFLSAILHALLIAIPDAQPPTPKPHHTDSTDLTIIIKGQDITSSPQAPATPSHPSNTVSASSDSVAEESPGISPPPLSETKYFEAKELDELPQPLQQIQPHYPPEAPAGQNVAVHIEVLINEEGHVVNILNRDSADNPFYFAAKSAFENANFLPGKRAGEPVPTRLKVVVRFD